EKSPAEIRALAKENFRRLGESYGCAVKTASMSDGDLEMALAVTGAAKVGQPPPGTKSHSSCVMAIGHFGNFELYARCARFASAFQFPTTYRALRQPALNRLMHSLRERSGCLHIQPRTAESIMLDINHAFEAAIRRDPANWFWVHKRWKPGKWKTSKPSLGIPGDVLVEPAAGEEPRSQ